MYLASYRISEYILRFRSIKERLQQMRFVVHNAFYFRSQTQKTMAIQARMNHEACNRAALRLSFHLAVMAFVGLIFCTDARAQTPVVPDKPADTAAAKRPVDGYVKLTQSANLRKRAARDAAYKKKLCGKIKSQLENFESYQGMGRAPIMLRMRLELATTCSTQAGFVE
jgi:hypothetical protein